MKDNSTLFAISSLISALFPISLQVFTHSRKVSKIKRMIELLEYRRKIIDLLSIESNYSNIPKAKDKLSRYLFEIEKEFIERKRIIGSNVILFLSVEMLFVVYVFNKIWIKLFKLGVAFLEGIFAYPSNRIIGLLLISVISYMITYSFVHKYANSFRRINGSFRSLITIIGFNLIFVITIIIISLILSKVDDYVRLF